TVLPRTPSRAENPDDHFAVSGEDGSFRFDGVEERGYVLTVLGDRAAAASVDVRGGAEDVVLRLRPEAAVTGRVVDGSTGEPVQRFTLVASPMAEPIAVPMNRRRRFDDAEGRFALSGIGPGSQYLLCEAAGFARTSYGPLHVGPGERVKDLEIRL